MRVWVEQPGMVLSSALHVALVVFGLVSLAGPKPFDEFAEAVPVDVISDQQFREMTRGAPTEKEVRPDTPQRIDRIAKVEEQKDPGAEKKDVPVPPPPPLRPAVKQAEVETDPPPAPPKVARVEPPKPAPPQPAKPEPAKALPPPKPPSAKPEEEDEAEIIRQKQLKQKLEQQKAEDARKAAEDKRRAEDRRRAEELAEAKAEEEAQRLAAERAKAEAKKAEDARKIAEEKARKAAEAKKAEEARKSTEKAESDKLQAAIRNRLLASREAPASTGSSGQQLSRTASAGAPTATGQRLSPSDREALMGVIKEQMERCWSVTGMSNPSVKPMVRLQLSPSGAIAVQPALVNNSADPAFRAIADSGMRAIRACAPYRIPARFADTFEDWKTITVKLDPSDLL